jgi:hypothetical protein
MQDACNQMNESLFATRPSVRVRETLSILKILLEKNIALVPMGETNPIKFDWSYVNTRREKVVYAGHSFGAATSVVLVKGVYHVLEFIYSRKKNSVFDQWIDMSAMLDFTSS